MSSLLEALLMRFGLRTNVTALNISTFSYQKLQTRWKLFIWLLMMISCYRFKGIYLPRYFCWICLSSQTNFSERKIVLFLTWALNKFWGNSEMMKLPIHSSRTHSVLKTILCRDCYRQMTGKVMSLIDYGAFTHWQDGDLEYIIFQLHRHFWKTLSMVISGSVLQPLVSDASNRCQEEYASHL
jgi:hypothetical protein